MVVGTKGARGMLVRRMRMMLVLLLCSVPGCIQNLTQVALGPNCSLNQALPAEAIPPCLRADAVISESDEAAATRVINGVRALRDSLRSDTGIVAFTKA